MTSTGKGASPTSTDDDDIVKAPGASSTSPAARRPLRADAQRNRERLLDVALEAFVDQGIGAPLDEIARRAGVGIGTLYRHFPSREALVDALVRDGVDELCRKGDELAGSADPMGALATWLRALVDHAARFSGLAASIAAANSGAGHDAALANSCARVNAAGGALMARAREAGQLRPDVDDADIIDLAASIAWITDHAPRDEGQTDRLLALVLDAMTTRPSAAGPAGPPPADRPSVSR